MYSGYDHSNVFAKILLGELPCTKVYENDHVLCFLDIIPKAKTHLLLIPKGPYVDVDVFARFAPPEEIAALTRAIHTVLHDAGGSEFYIKINTGMGPLERQEVMHFHMHLMSLDGHTFEPIPQDLQVLLSCNDYTTARERGRRAWIRFASLADFDDPLDNIFTPITDLAHCLDATAGFNLHLIKTNAGLCWRIDW